MLKDRTSSFYYDQLASQDLSFDEMIIRTKIHFETKENRQFYMQEWRETTYSKIIRDNSSKNRLECLQILFDTLTKIERDLSSVYQQKYSLRNQIISACRDILECSLALYNPADIYEKICSQLRSAIETVIRARDAKQFSIDDINHDQNWTNQTYRDREQFCNRLRGLRGSRSRDNFREYSNFRDESFRDESDIRQKKCYVCEKLEC
jgi:hypothetical protein